MKRMAIIRNARFGVLPLTLGVVGLSFDSMICEQLGARHVITPEDAVELLAELQAADVSELNGKPVWVRVNYESGSYVVTFDGPCLV